MKAPSCIGCKHLEYKVPASYTRIPHTNGYACKINKFLSEQMNYFFIRRPKECWEKK